ETGSGKCGLNFVLIKISSHHFIKNTFESFLFALFAIFSQPSPRIGSKHNSTADTQPRSSVHQFGDLMVQASDRVGYAHFTVRQFDVTELSTGNVQHVVQYHFHSWASPENQVMICKTQLMDEHPPDSNTSCFAVCVDEVESGLNEKLFATDHSSSASSAPFDRLAFIEFYYRVKTASRPEDGPVVVHCGTGT
ncbi:hypothetical protein P879_11886, partial [Paragonimus westermani]